MFIGRDLTPESMMPAMLQSAENWNRISSFIHDVLSKKEEEERRKQKGQTANNGINVQLSSAIMQAKGQMYFRGLDVTNCMYIICVKLM